MGHKTDPAARQLHIHRRVCISFLPLSAVPIIATPAYAVADWCCGAPGPAASTRLRRLAGKPARVLSDSGLITDRQPADGGGEPAAAASARRPGPIVDAQLDHERSSPACR